MRFILERVKKITDELKKHIYKDQVSIDNYRIKDGHYLSINKEMKV